MIPYGSRKRTGLWGKLMPTHHVNLDALIIREDLGITMDIPDKPGGQVSDFSIDQLIEGQNMFGVLRKPDFQRETANWTPEQVVTLVKNFLDEELIPAIILWKAPNKNVFVIDGAHRLSALIAWVNDDYGNRQISQKFFGQDNISKDQKLADDVTRKLMEQEVGSYQYLRKFIKDSAGANPIQLSRARNLPTVAVKTQSVNNDAAHAEGSFYRINQGGAVIDDSEVEIIQARNRPEALAARALLRAGTGHKYWWRFDDGPRKQIEALAKEIYGLLYKPEIEDPIRTLDLPMAGRGYSGNSLSVLFEFVHLANDLPREKQKKHKKEAFKPLPKDDPKRDVDGNATIGFLQKVKDISELITSNEPKSLGLHPAVYSYSATGKFQPTAFFAQVLLVKKLKAEAAFFSFTQCRARFEDFLVTYKYFVNQLIGGRGAMTRGLAPLFELYKLVLEGIGSGKTDDQIKAELLAHGDFSSHLRELTEPDRSKRAGFSTETKAATRLRAALESAVKCPLCLARIHSYANTIDHKNRQQDGGSSGHSDNAQVTHPYCNSGYKEKLHGQTKQPSLP